MENKELTLGKVEFTNRGFEIIEFRDRLNQPGELQMSSLAKYLQPEISAVWLGKEGARIELDRKQVRALINHLKSWLKVGSFKLNNSETKE